MKFFKLLQTPLHVASKRGYADIVSILIEKGADVFAQDIGQRTPKDLANINMEKDVFKVLQFKKNSYDIF